MRLAGRRLAQSYFSIAAVLSFLSGAHKPAAIMLKVKMS
jgi:hypothetical protein